MSHAAAPPQPFRRVLVGAGLLATLAGAAVLAARWADGPARLPVYDWVLYWSAGRLSLAGQDPYDRDNLYAFQKQERPDLREEDAIRFYNPPWALPLLMPFGLLWNFTAFRLAWGALLLVVVLFAAARAWRLYGGPAERRWLAWALAFTFLPVLHVLQSGQVGPLVLLGLVGFLGFLRRGEGLLAGAVLLLAAVKPHLVYLFWPALLLWAVDRRRWWVLAGGLAAGLVALAVPLWNNPQVLRQFAAALAQDDPSRKYVTNTLGSALRLGYRALGFGDDLPWLQYLPALFGLAWLPFYYAKQRGRWDWGEQLPLLVFVSFLTAPYGAWVADMVVLLLPLLQAVAWLVHGRRRGLAFAAAVAYLLIGGTALKINSGFHYTYWFVWMPPALFLVYLLLRRQCQAAAG